MAWWKKGQDEHDQPIDKRINAQRVAERTIDEMLGICKGILADGVVVPAEAKYLRAWLNKNREIAEFWPANVLEDRLRHIFSDGRVDADEIEDLRELLAAVTGEKAVGDRGARKATQLPLNDPLPIVQFGKRQFCFTGKFVYGARVSCEQAVADRGGTCQGNPTLKTDYLVIGTLGSRDWIHTSYGRKIEFAVTARDDKSAPIAIIDEAHWHQAIAAKTVRKS